MTQRLNGVIRSVALAGALLIPGMPVWADDDDHLRIEGDQLFCYDNAAGTKIGQLLKYSAPDPTTLYASASIVGRERNGGAQKTHYTGSFDQAIPSIFFYESMSATRYRSLRSSMAGVDSLNA